MSVREHGDPGTSDAITFISMTFDDPQIRSWNQEPGISGSDSG